MEPGGLTDVVELAGRCALLADGRVVCKQTVAAAPDATAEEFTPVAGLSEVAQIAAGFGFTCARKKDRSVWCWGSNLSGGLGDGGDWWWHEQPMEVDLR